MAAGASVSSRSEVVASTAQGQQVGTLAWEFGVGLSAVPSNISVGVNVVAADLGVPDGAPGSWSRAGSSRGGEEGEGGEDSRELELHCVGSV